MGLIVFIALFYTGLRFKIPFKDSNLELSSFLTPFAEDLTPAFLG